MIKIKINSLSESENIADFYQESGEDMRIPDRKITSQLPDNSFKNRPPPISHDQTAHLAVPTNKKVDEEYELDEDMLYEKKDRCYNLAKQKYDVFPSAYASGFIVRCRKGKVGKRKKKVNESVPQPGESSGKAKEFKSDSKPIKKLMSIDELVKKHPNIPYYKEVLSDYRQNDLSWPVTTKVLEYAKYLKNNPESVSNLPPIIFIDDNINDGAHRTSALWLLKNELDKDNSFWETAKLKVEYYKNEDVLKESSQYSQKLQLLVDKEQKLRNEFAKMMDQEGGWSHELLKKFMEIHGTQPHDVFDSEGVEKELVALESELDYENFSDSDWDNFWLLSQHADKHPDFQKKALSIIKQHKGKDSKEYKKLLFRLGSNKGSIKTPEGQPVDLDKIDDMGINWDDISTSLNEGTFDKEKSQGLHGWFARKGGKGKSKGWVDCNTCRTNPKTGRKTCRTCGRSSGEKRSKYPACRPTPSACTKAGTSRKKSSVRVSWKYKKRD